MSKFSASMFCLSAILFSNARIAPAQIKLPAHSMPGADDGLLQAFERAEYSLQDSGNGTWRGVNRAQRLTLEWNGDEARLNHPNGSLAFHLTGYGYGNQLRKPARATLSAIGNRMDIRRGDLTEWYLNGSQGLEQGFTLARRPAADNTGNEPLVIALGVSGDLVPYQGTSEESVVFESRRGAVLRYAGLKAVDATGRIVPSRLETRGHQVRLIVADRRASYPLVVDPTWTQQAELTSSDGAANDYFGSAVSVSGNTAVIGACNKTIGSNVQQGSAYVFTRSNGVWTQQQELVAPDAEAYSFFGYSVSVSGDTAVIGTNGRNVVYIYVNSGGVWTLQGEIKPAATLGYSFGTAVAVEGNTLVIGAPGYTLQSSLYQGAAYVFQRSGNLWLLAHELAPVGGAPGDGFGGSVALSGNTVLVGASLQTFGSNTSQGAAYLFVNANGGWSQQQQLVAPDGAPFDDFGDSVSVSGDTAVIGAWNKQFGSNIEEGAVYVFTRSGTVWGPPQELMPSNPAEANSFGISVSVSGNTAAIGAFTEKVGSNLGQGAAYVFVNNGGIWTERQELLAANATAFNQFGQAVAASGNTVVVGANFKDVNSNSGQGAAYVFVY
jgi:hypothetical protein